MLGRDLGQSSKRRVEPSGRRYQPDLCQKVAATTLGAGVGEALRLAGYGAGGQTVSAIDGPLQGNWT